MKRAVLALVLLGASTLLPAADTPFHFDQPEQAARYDKLAQELRCLVCQNQSLADSHADLAQDLRNEVYRMITSGKTDKEISLILALSHATVRYHIQRAGEKLNAVNRSQAVFKAGQLGYLGAAA